MKNLSFAVALSGDHIKQECFQMLVDSWAFDNLVSENAQSKVVDTVNILLLDIDPIHIHQNIANHHHCRFVILPLLGQGRQKVVVQCL